jgi:hypothetical protein
MTRILLAALPLLALGAVPASAQTYRDANGTVVSAMVPIIPGIGAMGLAPGASSAAETSHVFKASGGSVYVINVTNFSGNAGALMIFDAAGPPADGAVAPKACVDLPALGHASFAFATPGAFMNGIVAVASSGQTCFTKNTTSNPITGFFSGQTL